MGSVVIINNKPYKFNNFEKEIMAKRGINAGIVSKRVRGCWSFRSFRRALWHAPKRI